MAVPWEAVGGVVGVVGVGVGIWGLVQAHNANEREKAARAAAEEATLAATEWMILSDELHPRAGLTRDRPPEPPILIRITGANVWLHEVRLSWGFATEDEWTVEDGACAPFDDGVTLPQRVYAGDRKLGLGWAGAPPAREEQLRYRMRASCSLTQDGATHWRDIRVSGVAWQSQ